MAVTMGHFLGSYVIRVLHTAPNNDVVSVLCAPLHAKMVSFKLGNGMTTM